MLLKALIFLYFILLIFEGALRKWVLPELAIPLLIVRDPVVILIYFIAIQLDKFALNSWITGLVLLALGATVATLIVGHGNPYVTAYGFRANFLHVPLIFVMARALTQSDLIKYARLILLMSIPMTVLIGVQFFSEPTDFVNIGVGGEGTASFSGGGGRMRSSGTFSFITGVVAFYSLAFACWGVLLLKRGTRPYWLLVLSGVAIVIAIPLSISRALLVSVAIIAIGGAFVLPRLPGWGKALPRTIILLGIAIFGASQLPVFDEAQDAFGERWIRSTTERGGVEEAILGRIWNDLTSPFLNLDSAGWFGHGIGAGTQGGAKLLVGERGFLGAEGEWGRLIWEMGSILGLLFILYRVWFTFKLGQYGWKKLSSGNPLPWLLFLATGNLLLQGQWGQPTILGFTVFGAGMALASGKVRKKNDIKNEKEIRTDSSTKKI